jgi:hypothetical protein
MQCPRCGLPDEVPPTSWRCACGFDLSHASRDHTAPAIRRAGIGVVLLVGVPLTLVVAVAFESFAIPLVQAALGTALVISGWRRARAGATLPVARVRSTRS